MPALNWLSSTDARGLSAWLWAGCAAAFFLGGLVKGILGIGLPLVAVPLLSLVLPVSTAIALVAVPVLGSNVWQAYDNRLTGVDVRRFSPLLAALVVTTLVTVPMTLVLPASALNAMMAAAVVTAVVLMAANPQLRISREREKMAGALVGAVSGALGGISSLTGPVIITYLMALKLKREEFIGNVSVIYLAGAIPLYAAMALFGRLQPLHLLLSAAAMLPMALGLALGKSLRGRISEAWFRRILLLALTVIAAALLLK